MIIYSHDFIIIVISVQEVSTILKDREEITRKLRDSGLDDPPTLYTRPPPGRGRGRDRQRGGSNYRRYYMLNINVHVIDTITIITAIITIITTIITTIYHHRYHHHYHHYCCCYCCCCYYCRGDRYRPGQRGPGNNQEEDNQQQQHVEEESYSHEESESTEDEEGHRQNMNRG